MERFNRRVVDSLDQRSSSDVQERATVYVLGDQQQQIPASYGNTTLNGFANRRAVFFLRSLVAIWKSDILLLGHINLLPIAFVAKLLRPRLKTLLFVHGIEVWGLQEFRRKRFYEPWVLRRSVSRVAAVSRYTADALCKNFCYPQSRITILPNAVDPAPTSVVVERCGPPSLLTVSRLSAGEKKKNVDKIIYALATLIADHPTLTLEIIGDGELLRELMSLAEKLGLGERVRFLGRVSDADLEAAYRRASIFVLPSAKEGFGIVFLEAWQQGLAVVGALAAATPEVVQNEIDGLLVDPQNPAALAQAIERLVSDRDLRNRLALAGKRKVEDAYLQAHFFANLNAAILETATTT